MPNTILTPTTITREVGRILHNNLRFCRLINRQYDNSQQSTGQRDGGSIRLRVPTKWSSTTAVALDIQDIKQEAVTLTRGTQRHIDSNFTTDELTQSLDDFSKNVLETGVSTLASLVDYDAMSMVTQVANSVGTPGTTPATALVLLQAQAKMSDFATPVSQRFCGVSPDANATLVDGLKGLFHSGDKLGSQYRTGTMGLNTLGFDEFFMTQSVRNHTTGSDASNASLLIDEPGGTNLVEGMAIVDIDGGGATDTLVAGDVLTFANVFSVNPETKASTGKLMQVVVTATATAVAGQYTAVAFSPALYTATSKGLQNVTALPIDGAAVDVMGSDSTAYPQNIAFHKDAFVLATVDLEMPQGVHFAARQVIDDISVRLVRQYRIGTDDIPCRIDVLYGYVAHRPSMACRIWG